MWAWQMGARSTARDVRMSAAMRRPQVLGAARGQATTTQAPTTTTAMHMRIRDNSSTSTKGRATPSCPSSLWKLTLVHLSPRTCSCSCSSTCVRRPRASARVHQPRQARASWCAACVV